MVGLILNKLIIKCLLPEASIGFQSNSMMLDYSLEALMSITSILLLISNRNLDYSNPYKKNLKRASQVLIIVSILKYRYRIDYMH